MIIRTLPVDDILRHLPAIMDAKQRLRIDVLVHSHDIMVHALARLRALCMAADPHDVTSSMAAMIFADAWLIVDQADRVRQALALTPGPDGNSTAAFLEEAAQARTMRMAMDRLSQRITTIAVRDGISEALFGTLSFVRCNEDDFASIEPEQDLGCELIIIARGTVPGFAAPTTDALADQKVDRPISNLRLSAAGASVRLDQLCGQLALLLSGLSKGMRHAIDAEAAQLSSQTGASERELRAPAAVTLSVSVPFATKFRAGTSEDDPD